MPLWYWITVGVLAVALGVMKFIKDNYLLYDIRIDDYYDEGVHCIFHPFTRHIEVINPETRKVVCVRYYHYCIVNKYFKRKGRKEE